MTQSKFGICETKKMVRRATQEDEEYVDLDEELSRVLFGDEDTTVQAEGTSNDVAAVISRANTSSVTTPASCPDFVGDVSSLNVHKYNPACFGAVSVFCHQSNTCTSCQSFNSCDDQCLVTFEKIKGHVDLSNLMKSHADGRLKLGRPTTAIATTLAIPVSDLTPSAAPTSSRPDADDLKEAKAIIAKAKVATVEKICADIAPTITTPEAPVAPRIAVTRVAVTPARSSRFSVESIRTLPPIVNPIIRLAEVLDELAGHRDYSTIRREYCELSILVNLEKNIAPAFRLQPKAGKAKGSPVYFEIHRDQLVIDLHWLHTMRERVEVRDAPLRHMFDSSGEFPFAQAWSFSNEKWKSTHRVDEVLYLTPRQQCQLVTLKGTSIADRLERATNSTKQAGVRVPPKLAAVRRQLNEWAEKDVRIEKHLPDYEALWMARELLGAGALAKHVAEIFAVATGRTLDASTVREKLKTLDKHVTGIS